ncbi:MAG: hypothetical protein FRX49_12777 [Trebouxia sp. A1-2]|nr:MAG: hypothetical protein FRX49_12777 [Trebouxia sp. A1-2]
MPTINAAAVKSVVSASKQEAITDHLALHHRLQAQQEDFSVNGVVINKDMFVAHQLFGLANCLVLKHTVMVSFELLLVGITSHAKRSLLTTP